MKGKRRSIRFNDAEWKAVEKAINIRYGVSKPGDVVTKTEYQNFLRSCVLAICAAIIRRPPKYILALCCDLRPETQEEMAARLRLSEGELNTPATALRDLLTARSRWN